MYILNYIRQVTYTRVLNDVTHFTKKLHAMSTIASIIYFEPTRQLIRLLNL